jgi:hypothetical protein
MVVFLLIGSGEVQLWAAQHPTESIVLDQVPLSTRSFLILILTEIYK